MNPSTTTAHSEPEVEDEELEQRILTLRAQMEHPNSPMTRFQTMRPAYLAIDRMNQERERQNRQYEAAQKQKALEDEERLRKQQEKQKEQEEESKKCQLPKPYVQPRKTMKDVYDILEQGDMYVEAWYAFCDVWDTECEKVAAWFNVGIRNVRMVVVKLYALFIAYCSSFAVSKWIIAWYDAMLTFVNDVNSLSSGRYDFVHFIRKLLDIDNDIGYRYASDKSSDEDLLLQKHNNSDTSHTDDATTTDGKECESPQCVTQPSVDDEDIGVLERMSSVVRLYVRDLDTEARTESDEKKGGQTNDVLGRPRRYAQPRWVTQFDGIKPGESFNHPDTPSKLPELTITPMPSLLVSENGAAVSLDNRRNNFPDGEKSRLLSEGPKHKKFATPRRIEESSSPITPSPLSKKRWLKSPFGKRGGGVGTSSQNSSPTASNRAPRSWAAGNGDKKGNKKVHNVVHRIQSAVNRVRSSSGICNDDDVGRKVSFKPTTDVQGEGEGEVTEKDGREESSNNVCATFESMAKAEEVASHLCEVLRGKEFGCDVACEQKKWAGKFKLRVVSLKRRENSILVVRIVVEEKKKKKKKKNDDEDIGSSIRIYPARQGGFKADGQSEEDVIAKAHFDEFVKSVQLGHGHERWRNVGDGRTRW